MDAKEVKEKHAAAAAELLAEGKATVEAEMVAIKQENETIKEQNARIAAELDAYKQAEEQAKVAKEAAEKQAAFEAELTGLLADLPAEKISENFTNILKSLGPDKIELIKQMIEERKALVISTAPVVVGEGVGGNGIVAGDTKKTITLSMPSEAERLAIFG